MIRVSIQLSPKSKVVDFLVLYNFYFGQISSSYIKFGALDGQSRLKSLKFGYCASPGGQCLADLDVGVATRHADEPRPSCSHTRPYPHGVVLVFASPFPFFLERAEHRATLAARRSPRRCRFRPPLAAVLRFPAPQAARPHPEAPSSLHEPVRANPGPNRPLCHRPPLLLRAEALPRRRAPLPDLPPLKSSRR